MNIEETDEQPDGEPQASESALPDTHGGAGSPAPAQRPSDMDMVASLALLRGLLESAGQGSEVGVNKLLVIEVPGSEWVHPVAAIAPAAFLDDTGQPFAPFLGQALPDDSKSWMVLEISEKPFRQPSLARDVAESIERGKTVFVVTQSIATLVPPAVRDGADHILTLPAFDAQTLAAFVSGATGDALRAPPPPIDYARLAPPMFRLARRARQSAEDYVRRLADMARQIEPDAPFEGLTLDELHGMPDVVTWAKTLAADIDDYRAGRLTWADCDRGALLCGPAGTGKTTVARAIAAHCQMTFIATSYAEWQSIGDGHLGTVTSAIRDVFDRARKMAPAIVFIDEIDTVGSRERRAADQEWWRSITNTLLEQLDGTVGREGVVVIAATNYPEIVDPALKRPGRLDRQIEIALPGAKALAQIFGVFLKGALPPADLTRLAGFAAGRTGAAIEQWVRGARRRARTQARPLTFEDVFLEIAGAMPDPDHPLTRRAAVHEAGHAVIMTRQRPDRPPLIALGFDGVSVGVTTAMPGRRIAVTHAAVDDALVILLAGRAAEEVVLGSVSAGAGGPPDSDLARATTLASMAESSLGLGSSGLVWADLRDVERLLPVLAARPGTEPAVRRRLDDSYAAAVRILTETRDAVETVAAALLRRMILTPEEVGAILTPRFIHNGGNGEGTVMLH